MAKLEKLKVGDVVRLKSGSPLMVVDGDDSNQRKVPYCWVTWMEGQEIHHKTLPEHCLELATKEN
jgi:uncharacterized protein YodC (DUF2158 family)